MAWKKLASRVILSHPRITVHEDKITLPSGKKSDYVHFGRPNDAVTIIAKRDDAKIFIQKEYSYPPDQWLFQFPGGGAEEGETVEQAATRELAEEGGLGGQLKLLGSFYTDNRRSTQRLYVFLATDLFESIAEQNPEEEFEDFWLQEKEVEELITKGAICTTSTLSAWALFKAQSSSN